MRSMLALGLMALSAGSAAADVVVRCDRGQSLNQALSVLPKKLPVSVVVSGTCVEYVTVSGFDGLTLRGATGATLRQPPIPQTVLTGVLSISGSQAVTVDGLTVETVGSDPDSIGVWIHDGSTGVRLKRMTVVGVGPGIYVGDMSEVSMAGLVVRTGGWGAVGIWHSKAAIEDSLLENPGDGYQQGVQVGQNAVLLIHGTRIRHMWEGIVAAEGGMVNVQDAHDKYPSGGPTDVVIDDPPSIQLWGLNIHGGRVALAAKLRILNAGSWWGGETGGVQLDGASSLTGGQFLEVRDSLGQGVFVRNNSHASLAGAQIVNTAHNAVAAVNHATVDLGDVTATPSTPTIITGSGGRDLFCDATSLVSGLANAPGAASIDCAALLPGPYPPLP